MTFSLQEKKGMYYAVFRIPDAQGNQKQKWVPTKVPVQRGNKRDAQKAAQKIAEHFSSGSVTAYPKLEFWRWVEMWLQQRRGEVDSVTLEGYESYLYNHIKPYFEAKHKSLEALTAQDIQTYYCNKLRGEGDADSAHKLSANSLCKHHTVINGALREAVRKQMIPYNPAAYVTPPKRQKYKGSAYSESEAKRLLAAIRDSNIAPVVMITLFYGLRRSEAVGLKWSAVDMDKGYFTVQSTVVRFSKVVEKEKTKNSSSRRSYPITDEVKTVLLRLREKQQSMKELMGDSYTDSGYVFTWDDGRRFNPDYITRKFASLLKAHGLPHIRYHDLRHTTATLLLSEGYDLKRTSEWLGHSDIGTTADIYGHLSFETKKYTSDVLNGMLSEPRP